MNDKVTEAEIIETIDQQLMEYQRLGVLDYVLPTAHLGEKWTVGVSGVIVHLIGPGEGAAFLSGASAVANALAKKAGIRL